MVDDDETTQVDLSDVENEICRLPDVVAVRIVANSFGEPIEVHVLAHTGKHAKQIVRDIQSVALTSFGIDLDRRIVSVVQLSSNGETSSVPTNGSSTPAPPVAPTHSRCQLLAVESRTAGRRASIRITLGMGEAEASGEAAGPTSARARLAATATLEALTRLDETAGGLDVEAASVGRVGDDDVVTVTLLLAGPHYEQRLVGSALLAHQQLDEAAARAVLDAANRQLGAENHKA